MTCGQCGGEMAFGGMQSMRPAHVSPENMSCCTPFRPVQDWRANPRVCGQCQFIEDELVKLCRKIDRERRSSP